MNLPEAHCAIQEADLHSTDSVWVFSQLKQSDLVALRSPVLACRSPL